MPRPSRWNDLVRAAAAEFAEKGFDLATIEGIAERVGILKGSVYHYVRSKEELLFAVVERPATELLEYLSDLSVADISPTEKLRALFRRQIGIFAEYYPAAFVYLGLIGRNSQPQAFRERDARYMDLLEGILRDGVACGDFQLATSPRVTALAVVGILDWMEHWYTPLGEFHTEDIADALFSFAVGGLSAGGSLMATLPPIVMADQVVHDGNVDDPVS